MGGVIENRPRWAHPRYQAHITAPVKLPVRHCLQSGSGYLRNRRQTLNARIEAARSSRLVEVATDFKDL